MLNDVQMFIDKKIAEQTEIQGRWIDNFKIIEKMINGIKTTNNENQVVIKLLSSQNVNRLKDGSIMYKIYNFEIWVLGNENKQTTRGLVEKLYDGLDSNYSIVENNTRILMTKTEAHSFQFDDGDNAIYRFTLEVQAQTKLGGNYVI